MTTGLLGSDKFRLSEKCKKHKIGKNPFLDIVDKISLKQNGYTIYYAKLPPASVLPFDSAADGENKAQAPP